MHNLDLKVVIPCSLKLFNTQFVDFFNSKIHLDHIFVPADFKLKSGSSFKVQPKH